MKGKWLNLKRFSDYLYDSSIYIKKLKPKRDPRHGRDPCLCFQQFVEGVELTDHPDDVACLEFPRGREARETLLALL